MLACALPLALLLPVLDLLPEHRRPDPFGAIAEPDRGSPEPVTEIAAARGGYVSFHAVAKTDSPGPYEVAVASPLAVDLYREWFHSSRTTKGHVPDALIPVKAPYRSSLPEPANRIPGQTAQAFWIDVWIPADTRPGGYRVTVTVSAGGQSAAKTVMVRVLSAVIPAEDAVTMDHNSYGSSFLGEQYPALAARYGAKWDTSDRFFQLIHAYHRIFREHRGVFHQLGYGHGGKVAPEFAPALAGSGRDKRIADWDLFDRHYGPLLDGSAFGGARLGSGPISFVYLPINPEWPASFLWWGEPGYETEFVNVVSAMERHFREKGWTRTRFELFFNHKKRYKAFPWDGDEVRFLGDNRYFKEYARLMRKAVPADTPVRFVFRNDASWAMEQQFQELAGVTDFWICSSGMLSWNRDAVRRVLDRGDIVWSYGSPPEASKPSAEITGLALRTFLWGIHGFVHWLTVSAGRDPWFQFDGGGTALVYPGEKFGIEAPIPSVRLKLQRNALQDLALAKSLGGLEAEISQRFNESKPEDWWTPRPERADRAPEEWTNNEIDDALAPAESRRKKADAASWYRVREAVMRKAEEKSR